MSDAKHTPGPWQADLGEAFHIREQDGGRVAQLVFTNGRHGMKGRRNGNEVAANARLIAAAPDLLEALEEIRDILWSRPDISDRLRPLMGFAEEATNQKAARAIAKARGQS